METHLKRLIEPVAFYSGLAALVGLSAVETEMQRNMELLKERGWFDIPIVYNNGRRAILAIEKGEAGARAFDAAFAAWESGDAG